MILGVRVVNGRYPSSSGFLGVGRPLRLCSLAPLLASLAGCAGEPRQLPPAEPPPRTLPNVIISDAPLPPHRGRVVLDTTDGPMRVTAKFDPSFTPPGGSTERGVTGELCVTPCVVELPVGKYRFFFSPTANADSPLGDSDDLVVNEGVTIYRRAPGLYRTPSPVDQIPPAALFIAGVAAVSIGALAAGTKDNGSLAGGLLVGGSVAMIGGGIWGYEKSRATQRDGASTVWQLGTPALNASPAPAPAVPPVQPSSSLSH